MKHLLFLVIALTSRGSKLQEDAVPLKLREPPNMLRFLIYIKLCLFEEENWLSCSRGYPESGALEQAFRLYV